MIVQNIPDSITNWVTTVTCLSNCSGMGISKPIEIRAFQPFFLDYILPFSIKLGEVLHLEVILNNYLEFNAPVSKTAEK